MTTLAHLRFVTALALTGALCSPALVLAAPPSRAAAEEPTDDATNDSSKKDDEGSGTTTESNDSPTPGDALGTPKTKDGEKPAESEDTGPSAKAEVAASVEIPSAESARFRRFWFGVAGSLDLAVLAQANSVCSLDLRLAPITPGRYCTNPDGSDFPNRVLPAQNAALVPGNSGMLDGGFKVADVRVLFAADYAVTPSILVGVRLGYVANTYTGDAARKGRADFLRNTHLEARGTYVFGHDALSTVGFAPMAFAGLGAGTFDAHATTQVSLAGVRGQNAVTAWQIGGPAFFGIGGGTRYTFSSRAAFSAAWRLSLAFGIASPLFTMGPEVSFQYGF